MPTIHPALHNKIALVTGGSRGIGRAIAHRLAADGALVAVHYGFQKEAAADTVDSIKDNGGEAFSVQAALGVPDDAQTLWENFDRALSEYRGSGEPPAALDILVNNAGQVGGGPFEDTAAEELEKTFAVNATAPFQVTTAGLDRLRDQGRIINISSGVSRIPWTMDPSYAMSKAALDSLTRSLARKVGSRNITVNSVGPGFVKTDINADWLDGNPEAQKQSAEWSVFNRLGQVDDVADIVGFLASEKSRWITGQFIDATGGALLSGQ